MGTAITVLLGWMGRVWALIDCSRCQGGEQGGLWTREGAGRGVGLCGFPALLSSTRELEAAHSLLQRELEGSCCRTSIQAPVGPAAAVRTDPQFAWPHCASKASPSAAGL